MSSVTIVVVPRERFSCTPASLDSIEQHTNYPYRLVYIDGNSPQTVKEYLNFQRSKRNFNLLRFEHYLYPNQAKNIALQYLKSVGDRSKYVVFIDNDVIVSPGWLEYLVECAEVTNGSVVTPLICVPTQSWRFSSRAIGAKSAGHPLHQKIHMAGGDCYIRSDREGKRHLWSEMHCGGKLIEDVRPDLYRRPTSLIEFHCFLIRREALDKMGQFDPMMYSTREHIDFCLSLTKAGEPIYFEPQSIVTYFPGYPQDQSDLLFYALRWSNHWKLKSLYHLRDKWKLTEDEYFQGLFRHLATRRQKYLLPPLISRLAPHLRQSDASQREVWQLLSCWENIVNDYLTQHHRDLMYVTEESLEQHFNSSIRSIELSSENMKPTSDIRPLETLGSRSFKLERSPSSQLAFVLVVEAGRLEAQSRLLVESIRTWTGIYADCQIWAVFPRKGERLSQQTLDTFMQHDVMLLNRDLNRLWRHHPISNKVYASALVEEMVAGKVSTLVFVDSDVIFLQPPEDLVLPSGKCLAIRPVHHPNVGIRIDQTERKIQVNPYWQLFFDVCSVKPQNLWSVRSTMGQHEIVAYFNVGLVAVDPKRGLFGKWLSNLEQLSQNPIYKTSLISQFGITQPPPSPNSRYYRPWYHLNQVLFACTVLSSLDKEDVEILSPLYNYPLQLQTHLSEQIKQSSLSEAIAIHYHFCFERDEWWQHIAVEEPFRSWLRDRLPF